MIDLTIHQMTAIQKAERLHRIKAVKEEYKAKIASLDEEVELIESSLAEEAKAKGGKLEMPGLISVTAKEEDEYKVIDEMRAIQYIHSMQDTDERFSGLIQEVMELDKKKLIKVVKTHQLDLDFIEHQKKEVVRVRLAKLD